MIMAAWTAAVSSPARGQNVRRSRITLSACEVPLKPSSVSNQKGYPGADYQRVQQKRLDAKITLTARVRKEGGRRRTTHTCQASEAIATAKKQRLQSLQPQTGSRR